MKHLAICIGLLGNCFFAVAQLNYDRSDFEQINQAYAQFKTLQTEVDYVYYPDHVSKTPGETLHAVLSLNGTSYHYRLQDMETLSTPEMTLLADHEEKQIMLDRSQRSVKQMLLGADLDQLLAVCTKIRFSYPSPGIKKYELYAELAETERIDIYFHTNTFLMQRVVFFYNYTLSEEEGGTGKKPRLELVYRSQNPKPQYSKDLFSPGRFVQKSGDRFVTVAAFKGYQIQDYLSK